MDKIIYGGDTETLDGKPHTMQFYSEDIACDDIIWVDEKRAAREFMRWVKSRRKRVAHVVYVHNLAFDLVEFIWGQHGNLVSADGSFAFEIAGWHCRGVYGTPTFGVFSDRNGTSVSLIDSFSYYRGSLENAAAVFCPHLPKVQRPADLGTRSYGPKDKQFVRYAKRDGQISYHIGKAIEAMHQEFDIPQCVSVADMASRIYRSRFLDYTIPQPNRDCMEMALESYHGGKNNVTVKAGWYERVSSLDISSAYPAAMHALPSMGMENLYKRFRGRGVQRVPECGVYRVRGEMRACQWPSLFSHSFKPLRGPIDGVAVQGLELNEAIRSGEFRCDSAAGYYYEVDRDNGNPSLRQFVERFYALKQSEKDKTKRLMYKLILNSISGKFIQTRKMGRTAFHDVDSDTTTSAAHLIAGGMFHPFIASYITAHTRARIHQLEHKYEAIHTATDGIFTQRVPEPEGEGLGALECDARDGTLLLVRNKCYVLYGADGPESSVFPGRRIKKYALHGFQCKVGDLERLIATGARRYTASRPNRLREAMRRGLTPNLFVERAYTLTVGPRDVHEPPAVSTARGRKR